MNDKWVDSYRIRWLVTENGFGACVDNVAVVRLVDGTIHTHNKPDALPAEAQRWVEFLLCPPETVWDRLGDKESSPVDDVVE